MSVVQRFHGYRHKTSPAAAMTDVLGQSFTASNGQNGLYHRYAANLSPTKPLGLCMQLHGDGWQEYDDLTSDYSIGGVEGIHVQALYRDMMCIVARTPDDGSGNQTWWEQGYVCSIYLRDLINNLIATYPNLDRNRIWLVGYSGGSEQTTLYYLPGFSSSLWGGGALMFGGGGVPDTTSPGGPDLGATASLKANFPLRWWVGDIDTGADDAGYNAVQDSLDGKNYYASHGWTTSRIVGSGNHSAADTRYGAIWGQFLHSVERPAVVSSSSASRSGTTLTWTGTVTNAPAVTVRADASAFGAQAGTWAVGAVSITNRQATVTLSGLPSTGSLFWQVELGGNATQGPVIDSGTASAGGGSGSAAPTFGASGTHLNGSAATAAVAVPSGVTSGDIILVHLYKESTAAVTPPAGFTEVTPAQTTTTNIISHHLFWKRATATDTGTYTFSWTGSTYREAIASRYHGCITSGSPLDTGAGAPNGAARSSAATATPATSLTTQGANRLLVWSGANWSGAAWTMPSGFTAEETDLTLALSSTAYKTQATAGATGSLTGSCATSDYSTARLLALIPA